MLIVVDKPLIQYGVEEALEAGMHNINIITSRGKRAIEDYFDISYELEHQINGSTREKLLSGVRNLIKQCTFSYTRQMKICGLGHAILMGKPLIGDEPFGVILTDDLCVNHGYGIMLQMVKLYEKYNCNILAIEEINPQEVYKYGIIAAEKINTNIYHVNDIVEKPKCEEAPSNFAVIGRYVLTPDIFDILEEIVLSGCEEIQLTEALCKQAKIGKLIAYRFEGTRFDCGNISGLINATNYFFQSSFSC